MKTPSAFVSYSTVDCTIGSQVKELLEAHGIECFLAHEDLAISEVWKERILEELRRCDVLFVLLSEAFRESEWGSQEVGIIVGRGDVPIVPLSVDGTIPFGFMSHVQSRPVIDGTVTEVLVIAPLLRSRPHLLLPGLIRDAVSAGDFRGAEAALKPIVPFFGILDQEELDALVAGAIDNYQVWDAALCRTEYLPKLIELQRDKIKPDALKALEFQVEHGQWYRAEAS